MASAGRVLTEAELALLKKGPILVLLEVAGSDSVVEAREWRALVTSIAEAADASDELTRLVMSSLATDLDGGSPTVDPGEVHPLAGLRAITEVVAGLRDEGIGYRLALASIAEKVAEASGGQLTRAIGTETGWVRSAGTSAAEREAIESVRRALGV